MADPQSHDELISEFMTITTATPEQAQQYLAENRWDLGGAMTEFFTAQEEGAGAEVEGEDVGMEEPEVPYTGPRTLGGRPAPQSIPAVASTSKAGPTKKKGGIATLSSIGQGGPSGTHAGHGHAHDDDDDDSDDEDYRDEEPRDLFAGGEKSGLAVQDPSNRNDPERLVNDIMKKARANAQRPGGEPSAAAPPSRFRGGGRTLGSDGVQSREIPDTNPTAADPGETQTRVLHLWNDGFSVEDGPLRQFSDPQNAADLAMIRQGRAPLHLMNVRPDQPVDVQLIKHEEDYKAQPKKYKPFSGQGNRLGSPTPGPSASSTSTTTSYPASNVAATSSPGPAPSAAAPEVDSTQPTVSLRIQLADGTRLPARFNTTHTIGDVYAFISRANTAGATRSWVLATTFPNKDHTDKALQLGDVAEFKKGGTAIQKWT